MTPPILAELKCPRCNEVHWVIDHEFRGPAVLGGTELGSGGSESTSVPDADTRVRVTRAAEGRRRSSFFNHIPCFR